MNLSGIPTKFPIAWASGAGGGYIRPIPTASQIGITPGAASLADGFPPLCFSPVSSGGVPPFGQDMNGILNEITLWNQWQQAGGPIPYDGTFQSAIGGYPKGAVVASVTTAGLSWLSTADANTTNPDSNSAANWVSFNRVRLTANTTFYVSPSGSDTTGAGTSGSPWATAAHALKTLQIMYDLNGFSATIFRDAGSYTDQCIVLALLLGQTSANQLVFDGAGMGSVTVTCAGPCYLAQTGGSFTIQNQRLIETVNFTVVSGGGGLLNIQNIDFGPSANTHINATGSGQISIIGNYTISGGGGAHWNVDDAGAVNISGNTITLTGTPAFSNAFAVATRLGVIQASGASTTFTGGATGQRYQLFLNSVLDTNGKGTSYLPGSSAGTTASGSQYN